MHNSYEFLFKYFPIFSIKKSILNSTSWCISTNLGAFRSSWWVHHINAIYLNINITYEFLVSYFTILSVKMSYFKLPHYPQVAPTVQRSAEWKTSA